MLPRVMVLLALLVVLANGAGAGDYTNFETVPLHPLALSPSGERLFAVNTPDCRLEIFTVQKGGLIHEASVAVGMDPVSVAARSEDEVWVVNHLSDSVSVVDVSASPPRVVRTLYVGDEPWDVVFAGERETPEAPFPRAFVSATRRGQNHPDDVYANYKTPGIGRADVWVFDAEHPSGGFGGSPETIVTLFGDKPRALAASPDGSRVLVGVFHSGNRTTAVNRGAICDGGPERGPCILGQAGKDDPPVDGIPGEGSPPVLPGGLPAPTADADGVEGEKVGLIVKFDEESGQWQDELGRNWNGAIPISLPDWDVFELDAAAEQVAEVGRHAGVGTINYDVVVNPDGRAYVAATQAVNEVRFEGSGERGTTVRGHLHEAWVTVIDDEGVHPRHLNKHIDYDAKPVPPGVKELTLAQPVALALSGDGSTLYVAAFGSDKIGVFDTLAIDADSFVPSTASQIHVSGGGPAGMALDEPRGKLYVYTRFDNGISIIDLDDFEERAKVLLHDPEPPKVRAGRRFLYDATFSSSNGESSCGTCHVFGDKDDLAWDLGNPDGRVVINKNPFVLGEPDSFHPLKGPMTTQTLRGLNNEGPMHWRGDRSGALDPTNGDFSDEVAAFEQFNGAFETLLGRDEGQIDAADMRAFADFALTILMPPNPLRPLDNTDTPRIARARRNYNTFRVNFLGTCNRCHVLAPGAGFFGTAGLSVFDPGDFKIPQLRNVYDKVGAFGFNAINRGGNDFFEVGDVIRGYGLSNSGTTGNIKSFLSIAGFNFPSQLEKDEVEDFVLEYPSNMTPIVGQQVTVGPDHGGPVQTRIDLLLSEAQKIWFVPGNNGIMSCDLVVRGVVGGEERGWYFDPDTSLFVGDRADDPPLTDAELRQLAEVPGQELTYTCTPPGSRRRMAVDRDDDGTLDGDERSQGTDPAAAGSVPGACSDGLDNDGDGAVDYPADPECTSAAGNSELPAPTIPAEIDVRPHTRWNVILVPGAASLPVALLGSDELDVDDVDLESLGFGPEAAPAIVPGWRGHHPDLDGDGHGDLLLRFDVGASGLAVGDDVACLDGWADGRPFHACDAVQVRAAPGWWAWLLDQLR